MLTREAIEKAIEMYEGGATESAVTEGTRISLEEARVVAEALYLGETERLLREVALAGVLEAAALALRSGRGLIGDGAADLMREIRHCYPGAGFGAGDADRKTPLRVAILMSWIRRTRARYTAGLECVECTHCRTVYPCECGANEGIPNIDPIHSNTGIRFAMSETQALLYNAQNWKNGLSLIFMSDSYELRKMAPSSGSQSSNEKEKIKEMENNR
jgi:hypothetical protein